MKRSYEIKRSTTETSIDLAFMLDGIGEENIRTGVGFFDHMLILFTKHGRFDLSIQCNGDLDVDQHHTVEDVGIVLGQAFQQAIGTKEGIQRYAAVTTPMDESLSTVSIDISGRPYLVYRVEGLKDTVGQFDTELVQEFFQGFVNHAGITLHINVHYGQNTHHMIESIFKGFGRALGEASARNAQIIGVPSTKGLL